MLSYRRRFCCLLRLCSPCRSPGIGGRALLRAAGRSGGLRDLLARCRWALGETTLVRGMAAPRRAQTVQTRVTAGCWVGGGG